MYPAPDGNNTEELDYLEAKILAWCGKVANSAIAVVDGSFSPKQKLVTACWILCTSDTTNASIKGWFHTPGSTTDMDAYRAEIHGI